MVNFFTQRHRWYSSAGTLFSVIWYFEVVFVFIIIGLLVSFAMKSYTTTLNVTTTTAAVSGISFLKTQIYHFYVQNRRWPNTVDIMLDENLRSEFGHIKNIRIDNGSFEIEFNDSYKPLSAQVLSFRRAEFEYVPGSTLLWLCGYQKVPDGMRVDKQNSTTVIRSNLPHICK